MFSRDEFTQWDQAERKAHLAALHARRQRMMREGRASGPAWVALLAELTELEAAHEATKDT
jgi:hypothetical protein